MRYVKPDTLERFELRVWVDPESNLPGKQIMGACEVWRDLGVRCLVAKSEAEADVFVTADSGACVESEDGIQPVASFWMSDGELSFRTACFHDEFGDFDIARFRSAARHEFGHAMGIRMHIKTSCVDSSEAHAKIVVHPDGVSICGRALMNAEHDPSIHHVTTMDALAFDLRDRGCSRLHIIGDHGFTKKPACIYVSPKKVGIYPKKRNPHL